MGPEKRLETRLTTVSAGGHRFTVATLVGSLALHAALVFAMPSRAPQPKLRTIAEFVVLAEITPAKPLSVGTSALSPSAPTPHERARKPARPSRKRRVASRVARGSTPRRPTPAPLASAPTSSPEPAEVASETADATATANQDATPANTSAEQAGGAAGHRHPPGANHGGSDGTHGGRDHVARDSQDVKAEQARRRALLRRYLETLQRSLGRPTYPTSARRRRLEGVVQLQLEIDGRGTLRKVRVHRSSGHQVLDEAALRDTQRHGTLPPPPSELKWQRREVILPIQFRLVG